MFVLGLILNLGLSAIVPIILTFAAVLPGVGTFVLQLIISVGVAVTWGALTRLVFGLNGFTLLYSALIGGLPYFGIYAARGIIDAFVSGDLQMILIALGFWLLPLVVWLSGLYLGTIVAGRFSRSQNLADRD